MLNSIYRTVINSVLCGISAQRTAWRILFMILESSLLSEHDIPYSSAIRGLTVDCLYDKSSPESSSQSIPIRLKCSLETFNPFS